jgi:hypothetical protein
LTAYVVQPKDSDLDAIAALVTTSFGRALLAAVDLPALHAILGSGTPSSSTYLRGDGTWSTPPTGVGGGAVDSVNGQTGDITLTASDVGAQPVDSDLTAIAALTTTSFGRSVLGASDAAALRVLAGAVIGTDVQAADSDLTAIAALTTTSFGRGLLTEASAASARSTLGLVIGTDVQAFDSELSTLAALTSTTLGRAILESSNASQVRTLVNAQALDTDLTAIAALVSAADKLPYATGAGTWALADFGSFARGLNALTTSSSVRTYLGLVIGTDVQAFDADLSALAALTTTSYGRSVLEVPDAAGLRTLSGLVIGTNVQAWDADLDAVAALTTTSYGRNFLTLANLAAVQALLGTGTPSNTTYLRGDGTWATPSAGPAGVIATDTLWDAAGDLAVGTGADTATKLTKGSASAFLRVNAAGTALEWASIVDADIPAALARDAEVAAGYQPLDSDLTAIAALTTTSYGRSLLAAADAPALRVLAGLVIGADVQAYDIDLASIAALTTTSYGRSILTVADAAALRAYASLVIGTNVQAYNAKLDAVSGLTGATDTVPYFTSSTTMGTTSLTSYARTLIDDTSASAARTTLGLGTVSTLNTGTASGDIAQLSTGGRFDIARVASGTPTGSKFVRDDGTLAVPAGGGSTPEGLLSGVINGTDATYGMVADGQQITNAALTSGATPTLTSASSPFIAGDVGKVVQLYRDILIPDASITSGTAILTSASNAVPTWVQPGMSIHVSNAGASGFSLATTVLTNDGTGQLTLAANASATVASKPALVWGLFKATVAAYTNASTVTLSGTSSYSFTGATAVWGTDNRAAFAAATAAAVAARKPVYVPSGNYVMLFTSTNTTAMAAHTDGNLVVRGGGRSSTNFMCVTDMVTNSTATIFINRGSNLSIDLADFKISYYGSQTGLEVNSFFAVKANRLGTDEFWFRMNRVDLDPTYRPIIGVYLGAATGYANLRADLNDCQLHCVLSAALSVFNNGARTTTAAGSTTSGSPTVTHASFALTVNDIGKAVSSTVTSAIPANSYVGKINSATSFDLSSSSTDHISVNSGATSSVNAVTIGGTDARVWARRCRFDGSYRVLSDLNDANYNSHVTYIHPNVSRKFEDCTFKGATTAGSMYHVHDNGSPAGTPLFVEYHNCTFEGRGYGVLMRNQTKQGLFVGCTWKDKVGIGNFNCSVDFIDCATQDQVGPIAYIGAEGTVCRVTGGVWGSTLASSALASMSPSAAGGLFILENAYVNASSNWSTLVSQTGTYLTTVIIQNCRLTMTTGGNLVGFLWAISGANIVHFRNNIVTGTYQYAPLRAAGAWTGYCVVEGNDFSGISSVTAAVWDAATSGSDGNFIMRNNKYGTIRSFRNDGRTGSKFTATRGTNTTAIMTTTTTLLLPDSDYDTYSLNPGSTYTLNNVCRHTQASLIPTTETVWLTNTSANTITLGTGTGGGALVSVGADTAFASGDLLMLRGNGVNGWHARIVS